MTKKILIILACVLIAATLFVACNENYKVDQKADYDKDGAVSSNGGLAVQKGDYIYFINGYAGIDVTNTFGDVTKGAIAVAKIDNGTYSDAKVLVSKNVYNTEATSGLYIQGDYIYYTTPSIDKDSDGKANTAAMWLMRTKLDGTDTKVIKKFDDYTPVFKVVDGYIIYVLDKEIHAIDLDKKFNKKNDETIDTDVVSYKFAEDEDYTNVFSNAIFYTKQSDKEADYYNIIKAYIPGKVDAKEVIKGDAKTYECENLYKTGFNLTLVDMVYTGKDTIRLFYNKADEGSNATSTGTYYYDFDTNLTFVKGNENRMSYGKTYSDFYQIANNYYLVTNSSNTDFLYLNSNKDWEYKTVITGTNTVLKVDAEGYIYYLNSNVVKKIKVFTNNNGVYTVDAIQNASVIFDSTFTSDWLSIDLVGDAIFFFNTNVSDNTYYVDLKKVKDRDADSRKEVQIGIITDKEAVTQLTA